MTIYNRRKPSRVNESALKVQIQRCVKGYNITRIKAICSQQPRTSRRLNQAKLATFSLGSTRIHFSLWNKAKAQLNQERKVSQPLSAKMKAKI